MKNLTLCCCSLGLALAWWAPAMAQPEEKLTIPAPESLTLKTKDYVQLQCTFYPGGFKKVGDEVEQIDGKTVVPVVLAHGWGQKRQDLSFIARGLQSMGHTVIVPDFRGHGRSTKQIDRLGNEHDLDYTKFRRNHIGAMVEDLIACKRHLMTLNNEGKLNIELLTVIGADVGAMVALNWIAYDWSRPQLPTMKQGQDIKAFILLSPPLSFKGATVQGALKHPALMRELDGLIICGLRDGDGMSDAKRIHDQLSRARPDDQKDLFFLKPDTNLSGSKVVSARGLNVGTALIKFIEARIVRKQEDFPWRDRTGLLGQ